MDIPGIVIGNLPVTLVLLGFLFSRDGRGLTDQEIVGMLIGLLMAGQHTSSTTSAWMGFYLAKNKDMQVRITVVYTC